MERAWQNRIYSELLPWAEVLAPKTLGLLSRFGLELVLAVRPWDLEALPVAAKTLCDAGVRLSAWPMLSDEQGRWANVRNAREFHAFALRVCDLAEPADVLFDLEPPFAKVGALAHLRPTLERTPKEPFAVAAAELGRTARAIAARGISVSSAIWPLVALDPPGERPWQSLLGTPVDPVGASHVSTMMYTSILEGWSRGAVRRRDARTLLAAATARTVGRFGSAAGMSLGCVGTGAFEDEPTYRDPSELADDVAIARAAGCSRLSLFDLGGVLKRGPAEAWLEAFVDPSSAAPDRASWRVSAARAAARVATFALGALHAFR